MNRRPRILLADDHTIIRDGLRSLLETQAGCEVIGEAADGRRAVELAEELSPDVLVIDVSMPVLNGIEAARRVRSSRPVTKIIGLSMHSDATYVGRMLAAGANGYLLKESAFDELDAAIRTVMGGGTYLSRGITGVIVDDYVRRLDKDPVHDAAAILTPKEREVLQLVAEGGSTKEIAAELGVSIKTIETHRQNIMRRLDLRSVAELTKFAIRAGLTTLD